MQGTDEPEEDYKEQYAARRRNQILVAFPLVGVVILMLVAQSEGEVFGVSKDVAGPVAFGLVLVGLAYSAFNWRCPACRKYLGKSISHRFCASCGVELR